MKKKIFYFFSMLFILLIVLRASYAYYIKSYGQENSNIVKTKCLNLSITNEKNDIKLDEQYPIPDSEGKKLTPYQFTITNTCEQFISYNVNLESLEGTTMDSNAIKVMVNNEAPVNLATLDTTQTSINNSVESRTLVSGSLGSGDSVDYALRLWMDYGDSVDLSSMNKVFSSKVVVTATLGTYKPNDYVATLHDAILINEYGVTDVNNAISNIEAKGEPDLNQTAPIITWQETEQSKTTQKVTKPADSTLNSLETFSNLNKNEQLMHICTTKTFDNSSARYILSNCSLLDPTELEYNSDIKYYYSKEYVAFDQSANKFYISTTYNSPTIYQIINATKSLSTATTNNISYNAIYYNLSVIPLVETEYEADKSDKGLYVADDDYGKTYYYRGNVSNNNVYFAGVYWQIVRINGDASIRMIYNGEELASTNIKKGINNKLYQYADSQPSLTDKESQFIYLGEIESKVSSSQEPKENFQANDDIVGAKVYQYENDIVILIDGKYFLYSNLENAENETVEFEGQLFNKSDLSEETLKWLEWYNSLPPEKQLTVSSIPAELYIDDGAGTVDADQEK